MMVSTAAPSMERPIVDRAAVVEYLAELSDEEFATICAEARGGVDLDVKELILRELARHGEQVTT